jgi:hypothetical protein
MQEILQVPEGLLPVVTTCIDEEDSLDVRRASTHVMYQILRISGPILSGTFLMSPVSRYSFLGFTCNSTWVLSSISEDHLDYSVIR